MFKQKKAIISGIACAALLAAGLILATLTLRSLGDIFMGLSSLLGEDTATTMLIPLLCAALLFWLCYRADTRARIVLCILVAVLALLVTYLSALFLSRVNDIRFIDLVLSLATSISDGLFDSL